eukprot:scaffold72612_cov32-Tisochrysis_lutea.AAC.1
MATRRLLLELLATGPLLAVSSSRVAPPAHPPTHIPFHNVHVRSLPTIERLVDSRRFVFTYAYGMAVRHDFRAFHNLACLRVAPRGGWCIFGDPSWLLRVPAAVLCSIPSLKNDGSQCD